jgi:hypothetical protein
MAEEKKSKKLVLLLQPQRLLHRNPVVQLLMVERKGQSVEMDEIAITTATVNLHLKHIDVNARKALFKFSATELEQENNRIQRTLSKMKLPREVFEQKRDKAMARHYQQYLGQLKHYTNELSWYHRVTTPGSNRISTTPCVYHPISVLLEFVCSEKEGCFGLDILVKTREGSSTY